MAGKFVLKKGTTGKFRFNLHSSNGKVIATSEAYETRAAAMRGIESVRKHAADARLDDQTEKASERPTTRSRGGQNGGRVARALKRDWEQTKADLPGLKGRDLNQNVGDTLEQAAGEKLPRPRASRIRAADAQLSRRSRGGGRKHDRYDGEGRSPRVRSK